MRAPLHRPRLAEFEPPAVVKGGSTQTFLTVCPEVGQKGTEQWWGLEVVSDKKCSHPVY